MFLLVLLSLLATGVYFRKGITTFARVLLAYIKIKYLGSAVLIGKVLRVSYTYNGTAYTVFLPYKKYDAPYTASKRVTVGTSTGQTMDMTQQPGVPYLVSAADMGMEVISITGGDSPVTLDNTKIPDITDFQQ